MKYTLGATIPTVQYGNLQPSIEVEADTFEEAQAKAMPHIEELWKKYGDKPLTTNGAGERITAFLGGEVDYDPTSHTYSWGGVKYLSASEYAKSLEKPFDALAISEAMAKKAGVPAADIRAMWDLKADISKGLGTMLHSALELYGKYGALSALLEKTTHLHDHPIVKKAVEGFYKGREEEQAEYEVVVVSHNTRRAGRIDRLLITGDKRCRIQDYKTNAVMTDAKLNIYWEQLKFYASILIAHGWVVEGLDIFAWDGEWETHTKDSKEGENEG